MTVPLPDAPHYVHEGCGAASLQLQLSAINLMQRLLIIRRMGMSACFGQDHFSMLHHGEDQYDHICIYWRYR